MSCRCCSNDDDMQWASDNAQFMGNNASDIELTRLYVEVGNQVTRQLRELIKLKPPNFREGANSSHPQLLPQFQKYL